MSWKEGDIRYTGLSPQRGKTINSISHSQGLRLHTHISPIKTTMLQCCSGKSISVCNPSQNNHISATVEILLTDNRFVVSKKLNYRICPLLSNHKLLILSRTAHRKENTIHFSKYPYRSIFLNRIQTCQGDYESYIT